MTKTYILDSVALAQGWIVATVENQAVVSGGTSATDTATIPKGVPGNFAFAFASPAGEPGQVTWPTGAYHIVVDVSAIGADLTLTTGSFNFAITSDLASTDSIPTNGTPAAAWDSDVGTGIKTLTRNIASWPGGPTGGSDDRAGIRISVANAATHTAEDLTLNLGTSTTYMDGPWTSLGTVARVPRSTPYPQLLAQ